MHTLYNRHVGHDDILYIVGRLVHVTLLLMLNSKLSIFLGIERRNLGSILLNYFGLNYIKIDLALLKLIMICINFDVI